MFAFTAYHGAFLDPQRQHSNPSLPPTTALRSTSAQMPDMPLTRNAVSKAKSTNSLRSLAALASPHEGSFHTIQDPRTMSTTDLTRTGSGTSSVSDVKKDEMAVLSDKLISAINHQQALDDSLAQARHELESERRKIADLEAKFKAYEERLAHGDLLTRDSVNKQNEKLNNDLEETRRQKDHVTQEKKKIETELETLTTSLFEEANKMVASANEQREMVEKKNQQLRDQIKDGDAVITSQMEQLAELKSILSASDYRKDLAESPKLSEPSTPGVSRDDSHLFRLMEAMNLTPVTPNHPEIQPSPATQFTHLLKPQCRTDVPCYEDFKNLVQNSSVRSHNPSHAPSRAGSGSYGGLSGLGLGSLSQANSSTPNLASIPDKNSKLTPSPGIPGSFSPSTDNRGPIALKDTRFFKRIMVEDIEPTLRLDLSPTISWLQRRSILAAVAESTLIVEPIPEASQRLYGKYTSCSVCGEARKEGQNSRTHAMRTKDGEGASKFAVCQLCLEKVRAVGDLIGYVRMVRDGVVKIADLKDEEEVWEEIIRLRERLFWARLAGGVVPSFLPSTKDSPMVTRPSIEISDETTEQTENKDGTTPNLKTPDQSRRTSEEGATQSDEETKAAQLQLQAGLDESLTTFDNARERALQNANRISSVPGSPATPARKRQQSGNGGSFPKISIPNLPQGFWERQVNTLS